MRRVFSIALFAAGVVGFELAVFRLAEIGTCASGGPYVIENACPAGTTGWLLLLFGSVAAMVVGGIGWPVIGAEVERRPRREDAWVPLLAFVAGTREGAIFWSLTALVILAAAFAPWSDASAGAQEGSAIGAGVLLLIGPGLWLVGRALLRAADTRRR